MKSTPIKINNIRDFKKHKSLVFLLPVNTRPNDLPQFTHPRIQDFWHTGIIYNETVYETFNYGKKSIKPITERWKDLKTQKALFFNVNPILKNMLTSEITSGTSCNEYVLRSLGLSDRTGDDKGKKFPDDIYKILSSQEVQSLIDLKQKLGEKGFQSGEIEFTTENYNENTTRIEESIPTIVTEIGEIGIIDKNYYLVIITRSSKLTKRLVNKLKNLKPNSIYGFDNFLNDLSLDQVLNKNLDEEYLQFQFNFKMNSANRLFDIHNTLQDINYNCKFIVNQITYNIIDEQRFRINIYKGSLKNFDVLKDCRIIEKKTLENTNRIEELNLICKLKTIKKIQKVMINHYEDSTPWFLYGNRLHNDDIKVCAFGYDDGENGKIFIFNKDDKTKYGELINYAKSKGIPEHLIVF